MTQGYVLTLTMIYKILAYIVAPLLLSSCLAKSKLSLWMDENQVEHLVGLRMKVYIVSDGTFPHYLRTPGIDKGLQSIPSEVDTVNLTWEAGDDTFTYWFNDLKSLDTRLLYNPLLSIPVSGMIPHRPKVFQMSIPCTGEDDGTASLTLGLQIFNKHGQPIRGSPMQFKLKKSCSAFVSSQLCPFECINGGRCSQFGHCECAQGYHGLKCERTMCQNGCDNNGTCMSEDVCICPDGFSGKRCERALCKQPCQNGGRCIQEDVCWCTSGFYGEACRFSRCKPTCRHGGLCIGDNRCRCPVGFSGSVCEKREKRDKRSNKHKKRRKNRKKGRKKKKNPKKRRRHKKIKRRKEKAKKNRRKQPLLEQVRAFYRRKKKRERRERLRKEGNRNRKKQFVR
ncbi:protein shifted-like isoform X2 [Mizuhopecten yessoensis]|uniref:Wnt inhibitory factor 1 n=1 Tax=Mizuhopecten yessoensis TaxID=6573 RepID=A0A210PS91_MIZYE|nr:protein shifted-like isoform X2 [Mizuhopecten yessoensis]OWF39316.1 Protein shifted [Mizuhopecten yessoensis]